MISVQNADEKATLVFVKPGQSTSNCSDPNATTVRVLPGAKLTADRAYELRVAATPDGTVLHVDSLQWACIAGTDCRLSDSGT